MKELINRSVIGPEPESKKKKKKKAKKEKAENEVVIAQAKEP